MLHVDVHQGGRIAAGAVAYLDSGADLSLVTEDFVRRHKLKTRAHHAIDIATVGQQIVTNRAVNLSLSAPGNEYMIENKISSNKLLHDSKQGVLMGRWRYPTCSIHGIEGAFSGVGAKTVIPAKVIGKFSLRLVPDQDPKDIEAAVTTHLKKEFAKVR